MRIKGAAAIFIHGLDVGVRGCIQALLLFAPAIFLAFAQRGSVLFALAAQASFLDAEVLELALICHVDFGVDEKLAGRLFFVREEIGKLQAAQSVDACLKRRNALQAPFRVGQRLDEVPFGVIGGGLEFDKAFDEL